MERLGQLETKQLPFEVKAAMVDDSGQYAGEFTGYAAGILNIDTTGDMILPGAFTEDLPRFLADGVVCWQHDWMTPIGSPVEAREDGFGLLARARISRTTQGLDAMTLIRDGVVKRLSIGYQVLDYDVVDRAGLARTIAAYGLSPERQSAIMASFDARDGDIVYLLKKLKLYEFSPVTVPANDNARIMDAKSLAGLTFRAHADTVLAAVAGIETRIKEIDALRKSEGRKSSPAHGEMCAEMADDLEKACGRLRKMAEELGRKPKNGEEEGDENPTKPELEIGNEAKRALLEFLKLSANF